MNNIIMHIDVNSAFLSWTAVDLLNKGYKLDIRTIVSVIGGNEAKRSGVVLAKSIAAKKVGIKSAETLYMARKKYPKVKVYPPDFKLYQQESNKFFNLLKRYTPDIEIVSIDECFIDYTKVKNMYGDEIKFAHDLKNTIYKELGFTVNIGVANNKLCAKMASDFTKPNRVHTLFDYEIKEKMWPLYIGDLYGVGKKSEEKLLKLGINTIEDLAKSKVEILYPYFKNQSKYLIDIANGIDNSKVISEINDPKCISTTRTLLYDYDDINLINKELKDISELLSIELRKKNKYSFVIAVIIKDKYFNINTHQLKLDNATNNANEIYEVSKKLFKESWNNVPVRLIGIRLDTLVDNNNYQISLFEDVNEKGKKHKLDKTIDTLRNKYGKDIIK